ncbi:MAG: hypothetical protein ACK4GQ_05065 [Candidatus Hadarchaeales archaeon]
MVEKKAEVRVFVDGLYLKVIDDLIASGIATNRSEAIRTMVHDWVMNYLPRVEDLKKYSGKKSR